MFNKTLVSILTLLLLHLIKTKAYIIIVTEDQNSGDLIFNSSVYKLGSDRHYKINQKRSAIFVNSLVFVEPHSGQVFLREKLSCDGIYYPNLFTLYIDSSSNRLRDVEYYSLPLRILITGNTCSGDQENWTDKHFADEYRRRRRRSVENKLFNISDKLDWSSLQLKNNPSNFDHLQTSKRNIENELHEFLSDDVYYILEDRRQVRSVQDLHVTDARLMHAVLKNRKRRNVENSLFSHADKNTRARIAEARQWISETYASFAIPTTDKWQKICLKKSQFINSVSAFLPKTIAHFCGVHYLEVSDQRFVIEKTQGDLVATDDVCILEPMWKVIVTFR